MFTQVACKHTEKNLRKNQNLGLILAGVVMFQAYVFTRGLQTQM
jgi:hypothetical protein